MEHDIESLSFKFAVELIGFDDLYDKFINNSNPNGISCLELENLYIGYSPFSLRYHFQERSLDIDIVIKNKYFLFSYAGTTIENLLLSPDMILNKMVIKSMIENIIRMRDTINEDVSIKDHLILRSMMTI
jgi:hypothetical protein